VLHGNSDMGGQVSFRTKPRDEQLSFLTECWRCTGELTVTHGRPEKHDCREPQPVTLADLRAALDNRN
jgi:hypothetical protein